MCGLLNHMEAEFFYERLERQAVNIEMNILEISLFYNYDVTKKRWYYLRYAISVLCRSYYTAVPGLKGKHVNGTANVDSPGIFKCIDTYNVSIRVPHAAVVIAVI